MFPHETVCRRVTNIYVNVCSINMQRVGGGLVKLFVQLALMKMQLINMQLYFTRIICAAQ